MEKTIRNFDFIKNFFDLIFSFDSHIYYEYKNDYTHRAFGTFKELIKEYGIIYAFDMFNEIIKICEKKKPYMIIKIYSGIDIKKNKFYNVKIQKRGIQYYSYPKTKIFERKIFFIYFFISNHIMRIKLTFSKYNFFLILNF